MLPDEADYSQLRPQPADEGSNRRNSDPALALILLAEGGGRHQVTTMTDRSPTKPRGGHQMQKNFRRWPKHSLSSKSEGEGAKRKPS